VVRDPPLMLMVLPLAGLDMPVKEEELSKEVFESLGPQDLINKVKHMGYLVMTPDELQAEIQKALSEVKEEVPTVIVENPAPVNEGVEKGVDSEEPSAMESLEQMYFESPESLTKQELVFYAKHRFGLKLKMTQKEATMIKLINEAKAEFDKAE